MEALISMDAAVTLLSTTKRALQTMVLRRQVPYYKVGRRVMFDRYDLINWQRQNRVSSVAEIQQKANLYCLTH